MAPVGVVIGRFQVDEIHEGHIELLPAAGEGEGSVRRRERLRNAKRLPWEFWLVPYLTRTVIPRHKQRCRACLRGEACSGLAKMRRERREALALYYRNYPAAARTTGDQDLLFPEGLA